MLIDILNYEATNQTLWKGRTDSLPGERFFQHVECVDIRSQALDEKKQPALLGFCCDEGIRRNQGRVGAKAGPEKLREQLAKLACHSNKQFLDVGNIVCNNDDLETAQQQFAKVISHCHQHGLKTVAFGGGHEIAWAHFSGLTSHYPKLGIINFDAHFDIRSLQDGQYGTSGTPFWQIKQYCHQRHLPFDYCCLGIQSIANTQSLFDRAHDWNVNYLTAEQMNAESFAWQTAFLDEFMLYHDHIYITICLDVFSECFAPGVSAPQAIGLSPWQALPLLKYIAQTGKVVSVDIAELSPPLDEEHKTSRLAAGIVAELLNLN
jgi:formiminoglutamase